MLEFLVLFFLLSIISCEEKFKLNKNVCNSTSDYFEIPEEEVKFPPAPPYGRMLHIKELLRKNDIKEDVELFDDDRIANIIIKPMDDDDGKLNYLTFMMIDKDEDATSICRRLRDNVKWLQKEIQLEEQKQKQLDNSEETIEVLPLDNNSRYMNDDTQECIEKVEKRRKEIQECATNVPVRLITSESLTCLICKNILKEISSIIEHIKDGRKYIVIIEENIFEELDKLPYKTIMCLLKALNVFGLSTDKFIERKNHYGSLSGNSTLYDINNNDHLEKLEEEKIPLKLLDVFNSTEETLINETAQKEGTKSETTEGRKMDKFKVILISVTFSFVGAFVLAVIITALLVKYNTRCKKYAEKHFVQNNKSPKDVKKLDNNKNNPPVINGITEFHVSEPPTAMSGCITSQCASPSLTTPAAVIEPSSIYIPISMSEHETISTGINTDKSGAVETSSTTITTTENKKSNSVQEQDSANQISSTITGPEYESVKDDVPPLVDSATSTEND